MINCPSNQLSRRLFAGVFLVQLLILTRGVRAWHENEDQAGLPTVAEIEKSVLASIESLHDVDLSGSKVTTRVLKPKVNRTPRGEVRSSKDARSDRPEEEFDAQGSFEFRQKGDRWYAAVDQMIPRYGTKDLSRSTYFSGFDGKTHYKFANGFLTLAQEENSGLNYQPLNLFYRASWYPSVLLGSFARETAKVIGKRIVRKQECIIYRFTIRYAGGFDLIEVSFAPARGWLPIESKRTHNGKPYSTDSLSDFEKTSDGIWYPKKIISTYAQAPIPYRRQVINIETLSSGKRTDDSRFEVQVPINVPVVDYSSGICYLNDPWWDDLRPWLKRKYNWPVISHSELWDIGSFTATDSIDGQVAPGIQASEWINGDPGEWNRKERKVTVLFFFGGRSISPTPKWLNAIRKLWRTNKANGVDLIGVATPATPERTKQAVEELKVTFPVAIDKKGDGASYGLTHAAFGLRSYVGVVVIDQKGIVHTVESRPKAGDEDRMSNLEAAVAAALADAGSEMTLLGPPWGSMDRAMHDDVKAKWNQLASASESVTSISGRLLAASEGRFKGAQVSLTPVFSMINGSNPHGRTIMIDRTRRRSSDSNKDGEFRFDGVPKGNYRLHIKADGFNPVQKEVVITKEVKPVEVQITMKKKN